VAIAATTTLRAIAYKTGMTDSTVSSATYTITLMPPIVVTVSPAGANLTLSQTQQFTATVVNAGDPAVTWSATEGTFSSPGLYTAPATISAVHSVTVTATSVADPSKFATATVNLGPTAPQTLGVFSTGVDDNRAVLADGSNEIHYITVSSADPAYQAPTPYVVNASSSPIPPWTNETSVSKWINVRADANSNNSPGVYVYRAFVDLGGVIFSTAVISGRCAADNSLEIRLNGTAIASITGYSAFQPFSVAAGFVPGWNALDLVVTNGATTANPTGVRCEISGSAFAGVTVTVSPGAANLSASQTLQFSAAVTGSSNTTVTWSATEGTITSGGLYTAPATISSRHSITVKATSAADVVRFGTATVTLSPTAPVSIGVFGTGVVSGSTLAADGSVDSHYTLSSSADSAFPGPNAYVVNASSSPIPPWVNDPSTSKWMGPRADANSGNPPGNYVFRTTFDLTGLDRTTAILSGKWAPDNLAEMRLNGTPVAITRGFSPFRPFTVTTGFVAGVNVLELVLTNIGTTAGPAGIRMEITGRALQ
jgi:hypothetical protein